ncbi:MULTISPECIES: hypothetical protein [unclassified Thioalkalivibrio]|uniref:hypothetical protein n=1 Tax=unclassified Thioalkalivibrio TaxID=2621013 RepID=UPI001E4EF6FC|nr:MULTISPECIES: hypothetical protein [unclassified Thioalkalivibrio]
MAKSVNAQAGPWTPVPDKWSRDPGFGESIAANGVMLEKARDAGVETGLGGRAPNDYPEFAAFRVEQGIERILVSVRTASW